MGEQLRWRYEPEALYSVHHVRDAELYIRRDPSRMDVCCVPDVTRAYDGWADLSDIPVH